MNDFKKYNKDDKSLLQNFIKRELDDVEKNILNNFVDEIYNTISTTISPSRMKQEFGIVECDFSALSKLDENQEKECKKVFEILYCKCRDYD